MSSVGNTVLPSQVKTLMGWQIGNIFYDEGEKVRTLGNNLNDETFSFEAGSNTTVRSIDFRMKEKAFTIPEGATVQFVNCSFSDTIVNNGTAVFDNCTCLLYTSRYTRLRPIGNRAPALHSYSAANRPLLHRRCFL